MTGLECLKEEMKARGLLKSQIESRATMAVLEILSNSGGRYTDMERLDEELRELEKRKSALIAVCAEYERRSQELRDKYNGTIRQIDKYALDKYEHTIDYINRFMKALEEAETPEARDALRVAQTFVNSVTVDTKYDNTAFIVGLAAILSKVKESPIESLAKINKKIPLVQVDERGARLVEAEKIGGFVVRKI